MNFKKNQITMYSISKRNYEKFLSKISTTEIKPAYKKYLIELNMLKTMKKYATQENRAQDLAEVDKKIAEVQDVLISQFGIITKNEE